MQSRVRSSGSSSHRSNRIPVASGRGAFAVFAFVAAMAFAAQANDSLALGAPEGPGKVFVTAEAAALDALAWCRAASRSDRAGGDQARGGTVFPVAGGFSYGEPVVANGASKRLSYRLRPGDVLHFRDYPVALAGRAGVGSRALSIRDRRLVDRRDPLRRPIYFATPDGRVRVYSGGQVASGGRTLALRSGPTGD